MFEYWKLKLPEDKTTNRSLEYFHKSCSEHYGSLLKEERAVPVVGILFVTGPNGLDKIPEFQEEKFDQLLIVGFGDLEIFSDIPRFSSQDSDGETKIGFIRYFDYSTSEQFIDAVCQFFGESPLLSKEWSQLYIPPQAEVDEFLENQK